MQAVARDFARPPAESEAFSRNRAEGVPGSAEGDKAIRQAIVHLHEQILGRFDAADSAEVDRTFKLFAGIVDDAEEQKGHRQAGDLFLPAGTCRIRPEDPHYTIRAWRGVVTYLLRRPEFLYE